jgi:hypothetical protein
MPFALGLWVLGAAWGIFTSVLIDCLSCCLMKIVLS